MPIGDLLVSMRKRKYSRLAEPGSRDLHSDGHAIAGETAGYGDRGHSRETGRGGVGAATEKALSRFLLARDGRGVEADRRGRMRRRGGEEEIERYVEEARAGHELPRRVGAPR